MSWLERPKVARVWPALGSPCHWTGDSWSEASAHLHPGDTNAEQTAPNQESTGPSSSPGFRVPICQMPHLGAISGFPVRLTVLSQVPKECWGGGGGLPPSFHQKHVPFSSVLYDGVSRETSRRKCPSLTKNLKSLEGVTSCS